MSFSGDVKHELAYQQQSGARHCQLSEIAAIITMCGGVSISTTDRMRLKVRTENIYVAHKFCMLLRKAFQICAHVRVSRRMKQADTAMYTVWIMDHEETLTVLKAVSLLQGTYEIEEQLQLENNKLLKRACCRRAFLRGAFLASGTISDPHKFYQLEIVCNEEGKAAQLMELMQTFELDAGSSVRKGKYVVYLKEGAQVMDMLNVMEAHRCLMEFENVRILRGISNEVNRRVNCDAANIKKTVTAAMRQIEDIRYIQANMELDKLSPVLRETALLRLEYPETPLQELGAMLDPPVGKSGINHRLAKLSEIARRLRGEE
ncbi:MAG: DNA-binding protein WhiA [Lachnospiraceae bacterium]|nr:DNA-binding protein WhiA [Lachnospiraceae bacterium]